MGDAWIVSTARTAIGTAVKGSLVDVDPVDLGTTVVGEAVRRAGLDPGLIDDVVMSESRYVHPEIAGFSITPGNSSGRNDGGAAVVVADRAVAEAAGLEPLAVVRAWASVGVPPADTGLAPTKAIPKVLGRAGLDVGDVSLWEINEAFTSMCVGTVKLLGIDDELVNVVGSGCSLGHPGAMTGVRMIISLTHELRRRGAASGSRPCAPAAGCRRPSCSTSPRHDASPAGGGPVAVRRDRGPPGPAPRRSA